MTEARKIVELGHSQRKNHNLKVRQPLKSMEYGRSTRFSPEIEELIMKELNLKSLRYRKSRNYQQFSAEDLVITPQLQRGK